MGTYTDEPGQAVTYGDLTFRAACALVLVACGAWVGIDVQPAVATVLAVLGTLAIVTITALKAWMLHSSGK